MSVTFKSHQNVKLQGAPGEGNKAAYGGLNVVTGITESTANV
jgi:hypothetical protein